jgi:hypothetical protein
MTRTPLPLELWAQRCGGEDVPQRVQLREDMDVKRAVLVPPEDFPMDAIIYLVGLVVVVMAILSFFGLH